MSDAKTKVRESILTHLQTWGESGLRLVLLQKKACVELTQMNLGNPKAALMFISEVPGTEEASQLLSAMIKGMKLDQEKDVYIANIVGSPPPENRKPTDAEITECLPALFSQIELVAPKIIVCLGAVPAAKLLKTEIPISKMRGTFQMLGTIRVMPTFHPAYLLRNPEMKAPVWNDLKLVVKTMKELGIFPASAIQ